MKLILVLCFTASIFAAKVDLDPEDNLNEEEFEKEFHVAPADDPIEELRREEALVENEKMIKETNEKFLNGEITWHDAVNAFDNLPLDEFEAEKTGLIEPELRGKGLLRPSEEDRVDERSERYFERFNLSRADVPASYNSKDLGNVSPVKDQGECGSCVAFATMAVVETAFKKLTGVFGDYSEQQFVDCGYGKDGARGCNGAATHSYTKWASSESGKGNLLHESTYPYQNTNPSLTCPTNLDSYNQGAAVSDFFYTYDGDEETMKKLVAEHGAVVGTVAAAGEFSNYGGGIFAGCTSSALDHAIAVVGYGTENGVDYWLIKNSWGERWGEDGFIRLKRGVGMCGIGKEYSLVKVSAVEGPTDAPLTTVAPCEDKWGNCPDLAQNHCYEKWVKDDCQKSCGLCAGMTPVASNTCYNEYSDDWCEEAAKTNCYTHGSSCKKSCGLCDGMTPVSSNTCYDVYNNCKDICYWYSGNECNLSCNRC